MRAISSCVVELRRFELWRFAVGAVASIAVATMLAWGGLALANRTADSAAIAFTAAAAVLASLLAAASAMRVQAGTLASLSGAWTFTFERDGIERIESGELAVAFDAGAFLLLVLTRVQGSNRLARRWLPVQRRGLEAEWHALRCAVYSPPPVEPDPVAANALPP